MRFIGVDLHQTQLTVCYLKTAKDYQFKQYRLSEIERFLASLEKSDQLAIEATGNTRWLVGLAGERVNRVVIVNPRKARSRQAVGEKDCQTRCVKSGAISGGRYAARSQG